ncbi:receptor-like protein 47 [Corylus avellana]|uniref:receptor-like protein 47 n=1 Tax=Corylus avellana TaxID=13451 RepID=UPI00286D0905|nr:receptor-like protein 47 [Corylus avellana]
MNEAISGGRDNLSSLFNLQNLQYLSLAHNNFNGSQIPSEFEKMTNLSYLNLPSAGFSGQIPIEISHLTTLVSLDLSSDYFSVDTLLKIANPSLIQRGPVLKLENPSLNVLVQNLTELVELILDDVNISARGNYSRVLRKFHKFEVAASHFFWVERHISKKDLPGTISDSIGYLTKFSTIDISHCNFSGSLPHSMAKLTQLLYLDVSRNKFIGPIPSFSTAKKLTQIKLSHNDLSGQITSIRWGELWLLIEYNGTDGINSTLSSSIPHIYDISLASCKLKKFPDFLRYQSQLAVLDLSYNQIDGNIPNWLGELGGLDYLNLSFNRLVTLDRLFSNLSYLAVLDLSSNKLQGQLPDLPPRAWYLDFLMNHFNTVIPANIGDSFTSAYFFFLSSNNFYESIPESICNATFLQVLDLSNNSLSGKIPQCLIEKSVTLGVRNLKGNKLIGSIPNSFQDDCNLQTLDLNGNLIGGPLPKSLANCTKLEVLNVGNNLIEDVFPCYLKNLSMLRALVLRSNNFNGPIVCSDPNATWPMLQIVDIASNNFTGKIPKISAWKPMIDNENRAQFEFLSFNHFYYHDSIIVTSKGRNMELVKILTIFTSIDFSCNNLEGPIPEEFGGLRSLYVLNLLHNALTGQIPPSLANLT